MSLKKFFEPRSIAIIGASRNPRKAGGVVLENLKKYGYSGRIYPVNPHAERLEYLKCYNSVKELPKTDMAVIVIPAEKVLKEVEECGKKGIKNIVILSGGFSEVGEKKREEKLKKIAKKYKIRIIGPNCIGVVDTYTKINTMFLPRYRLEIPRHGKMSFISQSGAVGVTAIDWAAKQKLGLAKMISYGNKADVDEVELLSYLKDDVHTQVIVSYFEGIERGRDFMDAAKKVVKKKPIISIKSGKSEKGKKAVSSHTGSLAGEDKIYDAAMGQCGVIRAENLEQMFDYAKALSRQKPAKGRNVAVITCGGGFGVMATDKIEELGLELPELKKETVKKLKKEFPPHVVLKNPLDLTGDANPEWFKKSIEEVLKDDNIDMILLIFLFQLPHLSYSLVPIIEELLEETEKPIVGVAAGSEFSYINFRMLEEAGIPMYQTPERAVDGLWALAKYGELRKNLK